ncbi:hypothetical protein Trydic_g665 [Trypoxylus dichotomus]
MSGTLYPLLIGRMDNRYDYPCEQTPGIPESDTAESPQCSLPPDSSTERWTIETPSCRSLRITTPGSPRATLAHDHSSWATRTDSRAPSLLITIRKWNPHTSSKMQIPSSRRWIE